MADASKPENTLTKTANKAGFQPGQIANPKGRPKGSKNKLTELKTALETAMVEQLQEDVSEILGKAVQMAKKGDKQMIRFVLERFLPKASSGEEQDSRGIGGINIIVQGMPEKSVTIEAEREDREEVTDN